MVGRAKINGPVRKHTHIAPDNSPLNGCAGIWCYGPFLLDVDSLEFQGQKR